VREEGVELKKYTKKANKTEEIDFSIESNMSLLLLL